MTATAYILRTPRCDGGKTRRGICAVKDQRHYGDVACIYKRNADGSLGQFIGYYEVRDFCPKKTVIDVWHSSLKEARNFGSKKVAIYYVKGSG